MTASRKPPDSRFRLQIGRREALLSGLTACMGVFAGVGMAHPWAARMLSAANGPEVRPAGGAVSQTAALQQAIDETASSGTPLLLPPGTYRTGTLTLRSGSQIHGVPEQTILKSEGGAILSATGTNGVHLTGLVLDGGALPLEKNDALLTVTGATKLDVSDCRFLNSGGKGANLRDSAGRIAYCTFGNIAGAAVYVELGFERVSVVNNIVDTAATGIAVTAFNECVRQAVVQGNIVRNLFFRITGEAPGCGIALEAGASVFENIVEAAPAYGIRVGAGEHLQAVSVTRNVVRRSHIGIGVTASPANAAAQISNNHIDGTQGGAIRLVKT